MDKNSFIRLGLLLGFMLILSFLMRLIFISLNFSEYVPLSTYAHSFLLGLRFDLSLNTVLLLPFIILLPFLKYNYTLKISRVYFVFLTFATILIVFVDAQYYNQMGNRFDLYAIKHLQFFKDHLGMLNMGWVSVFAIILLLSGIKLSSYFWESIKQYLPRKKLTKHYFF